MTDYRTGLLAGVPGKDDNADVPKVLKAFAGVVADSLSAHDQVMAETVRRVDPEQITTDASVRGHAMAWLYT